MEHNYDRVRHLAGSHNRFLLFSLENVSLISEHVLCSAVHEHKVALIERMLFYKYDLS